MHHHTSVFLSNLPSMITLSFPSVALRFLFSIAPTLIVFLTPPSCYLLSPSIQMSYLRMKVIWVWSFCWFCSPWSSLPLFSPSSLLCGKTHTHTHPTSTGHSYVVIFSLFEWFFCKYLKYFGGVVCVCFLFFICQGEAEAAQSCDQTGTRFYGQDEVHANLMWDAHIKHFLSSSFLNLSHYTCFKYVDLLPTCDWLCLQFSIFGR